MASVPTIKTLETRLELRNAPEIECAKIMRQAMTWAEHRHEIGAEFSVFCKRIDMSLDYGELYAGSYDPFEKRSTRVRVALEIMDKAWGTCGVEYLRADDDLWCERGASYLNTGDTYATTILHDDLNDTWRVISWGDFVESCERRGRKFS